MLCESALPDMMCPKQAEGVNLRMFFLPVFTADLHYLGIKLSSRDAYSVICG